jgi:hypothetical protein
MLDSPAPFGRVVEVGLWTGSDTAMTDFGNSTADLTGGAKLAVVVPARARSPGWPAARLASGSCDAVGAAVERLGVALARLRCV